MGDLIRDAFQASGIDEEMEKVIADAILQKWNDEQLIGGTAEKLNETESNPRNDPESPPSTPLQHPIRPGLDCAKVRLLTEQLWRRLERKYEVKLQAWKKGEEKQLDALLEKLRAEYKESIDAKHAQYNEMTRRKEEELRKVEERLREENRLEFEKRHMELQREWGEIEAERRDIRSSRDHLESAKANFAIRMENEEMRLRREKDAVERLHDEVAERARRLDELIRNAVSETERRERNWIAEKVNEWNAREAKLSEKCEHLCERIRQSGIDQTTIQEQSSTIKLLQANLEACRQKLAHSEGKLTEMESKLRHVHDYDEIKEENVKLRFELDNGVMAERLKAKEIEVGNLERRMKLVEEAATLRVRELKLQLKLMTEKLEKKSAECRKYRSSVTAAEHVVAVEPSRSSQNKLLPLSLSESLSSASANSSSSFDRNLRSRLKNLDQLSHQLDVSLEKYRSGYRRRGRADRHSFVNVTQGDMQKAHTHPDSEFEVAISEAGVSAPEIRPRDGLPTFITPLMTSTPLSTMDDRIAKASVDKLTTLEEASAETVPETTMLTPIALPANPSGENGSMERRKEAVGMREEDDFERRLRERAKGLRTASVPGEVEKKTEQPIHEADAAMQQYMSIVMQQRKKESEKNEKKDEPTSAKDNTPNADDSVEDVRVEHGEANSSSEIDW